MTTSTRALRHLDLPDEEGSDARVREDAAYAALLERLSRQSVAKHYDAFVDIPWDDPDYAIDPADPRFELWSGSALGASAWYRSLPQPTRARIGLHVAAANIKQGAQFESVLKRGLLEFATKLPNRAPEYRYIYHEVIEEAHHSLMFQEFVNRSGIDVPGMPRWMDAMSRAYVLRLARLFPELFFLFVLGGEDPIDHAQRVLLREKRTQHPLLRRISQIHVTEEARHLSFARAFVRHHVPRLSGIKLALLRIQAPLLLGTMARSMLEPADALTHEYGMPPDAVAKVFTRNPAHRQFVLDSLRKVRELCVEVGIAVGPYTWLWKRTGIWEAPAD